MMEFGEKIRSYFTQGIISLLFNKLLRPVGFANDYKKHKLCHNGKWQS